MITYSLIGAGALLILYFIWNPHPLVSLGNYLLKNEMPIWLSIGLALFTAVGTYFIAPLINQDFEFQKNRSTHVMNTVDSINKDIVDLMQSIRKFEFSLSYKKTTIDKSRDVTLDKITTLQWKLIDAGVIIKRSGEDASCTEKLAGALDGLGDAVGEASGPSFEPQIEKYSRETAIKAKECLNVLYKAARLG